MVATFACVLGCSGRSHHLDEYVVRDGGAEGGSGGIGGAHGGGASGGSNQSAGGSSSGEGARAGDEGTETGGAAGSSSSGGSSGESGAGAVSAGKAGQSSVLEDMLYIKASNPDAADYFGGAIALDGAWLAVGATNEASRTNGIDGDQSDDSEDGSGAVYLFSDDGSGWAQRAYVKASNTQSVDSFGSALALSGERLAVGAPHEDGAAIGIDGDQADGAGNAGAVYVFRRGDGSFRQEAYVKASNTGTTDLFGTSLDLESSTLVVGAPWEDSGAMTVDGAQDDESAENSGAVYAFERTANAWAQFAYVKGSYSEADDEFGAAISLSGETLAVGAPGESSDARGVNPDPLGNTASDSGAVYVFERSGGSYRETAFLKASNAGADDEFGGCLALEGDTLAVGAVGEATAGGDGTESNELAPESGAVYVFERAGGVWSQVSYLKPTNPAEDYYFGAALALSGETLVVGALGDSAQTRAGAVYVYRRGDDGFGLVERMTAPLDQFDDRYGASVAITPTLLAVGAYGEGSDSPGIGGDPTNNDTPGAGAVFLYAR